VAGRWFGVRGRRFVRPTLTLLNKGAAVRSLADLEHKPWAAVDGEVWIAAFSVDEGLDDAREIELSVAPDIVVELRPRGKKLARPGDSLAAGSAARAPRFKDDRGASAARAPQRAARAPATGEPASGERVTEPDEQGDPAPRRRRPATSAELERLGARLASANDALEQERERRAALAKSLEDERTTNRQLRTEIGQARSELEVAATARAEAAATEAELQDVRRQLREAERRHQSDAQTLTRRHEEATQALGLEHDEVTQAHAAVQDELREQAETLAATREALAAERAERGRLHNRLTQLQQARDQAGSATAKPAPPTGPAEPRVSRRASSRAARSTRETARPEPEAATATPRERDPTETQRFDVLGSDDELAAPSPPPSRPATRRAGHATPDPPSRNPSTAERLRPLNPSLRHRTWWFARLLALLVLCGVIAAVWAVLHSTVLH
jgi:hypothetical protein